MRPMLSDRCLSVLSVCLSVLSVTLVYRGQTVGWIKMKLGMEPGLSPGHIVSDGNPAPLHQRGTPQFSAHVCCGQTAGWIQMPLGSEIGFGPGHIVLDGDPAPSKRRTARPSPLPKNRHSPQFSAHVCCGQTVTHLLLSTYEADK